MFNLEQSIAEWRRQMLAAGIELSILTELESHLREEIEQLVKSKRAHQHAFEIAMKTIGRGIELKKEFKKVGEPLIARSVKLLSIGCGTISFMLSLWCLQFLFYQTKLVPIILGLMAVTTSVLCWRYSHRFLPAIHNELTRAVIGFVCCIASVVWIQLFIVKLFPGLTLHPAGMDVAEGRLLATVLWACTAMAVLSGVGYGLEKAAREHKTANS